MNFNEALHQIAEHSGLDVQALIEYANEDQAIGGAESGWSAISVHPDEARLLYAVTRALKPGLIVEVGTHSGCSATHMLTALEKNERGRLHSIDIFGLQPPGIPESLKPRWSIDEIDARYYQWPEVDMVFEDGDHTEDLTHKVVSAAIAHGAKAVFSHDSHNSNVGIWVCKGFYEAAPDYHTVLIDGSELGLAYWFKRGQENG